MIEQVQVVSGPAMLVQAAVEAVRQWVYRPTMLNNRAGGGDRADRRDF